WRSDHLGPLREPGPRLHGPALPEGVGVGAAPLDGRDQRGGGAEEVVECSGAAPAGLRLCPQLVGLRTDASARPAAALVFPPPPPVTTARADASPGAPAMGSTPHARLEWLPWRPCSVRPRRASRSSWGRW